MALIGTGNAEQLARKEQQLVFLLVRQLADAQMHRGSAERCRRLWQEAAALELDPERITWCCMGARCWGTRWSWNGWISNFRFGACSPFPVLSTASG